MILSCLIGFVDSQLFSRSGCPRQIISNKQPNFLYKFANTIDCLLICLCIAFMMMIFYQDYSNLLIFDYVFSFFDHGFHCFFNDFNADYRIICVIF